jgi:non-specific serine/threonine protein kinase
LQPRAILDLLASLVNKSLLLAERKQGEETRYRMLETIRQYAHEKLWAAGEEENVRQRHLAYYVDLAERAEPMLRGPHQVAWFDRLDVEHDNLRTALEWSQTPAGQGAGGIEMGLRLAGALGWSWFFMGWMGEGRAWVEKTLASSMIAGNDRSPAATPGRAKALLWAGEFALDRGDFTAARSWLEAALEAWHTLDDPWYTAFTLIQLGWAALAQQDVHRQHVLLRKSRQLFDQTGDRWGIALWEMMEGEAARFRGDDERAIAGHMAGAELFRAVGDEYMLTWALQNLAHMVLRRGDVTRANALFVEALVPARKFRSHFMITYCLAGLGGVAAVRGDSTRAARLFGAVDELFRRMGTQFQLTDYQDFQRNLATARVQVDEETFKAAWEEGQKMTLEKAVEYALEENHE